MIKGIRPFSSLLSHYLGHRDVLTANFARFGAGFILDGNIREAKEELKNIQSLLDEIEKRKDEKKPPVLFDINCSPCYRK
jgi:hypothetical protein